MGELENITYKERVELGKFSPDTKISSNSLKLHKMTLLTDVLFAVSISTGDGQERAGLNCRRDFEK